MKSITGILFASTAAFAAGLVTGLLLSPKTGKENREILNKYGSETKNWLESKSQDLMKESELKIDRLSKGIRKTVKDTVPDLYEATESLEFEDENGLELERG